MKVGAVPDVTGENNEKCYEYDGCDECERAEGVIKGRIYVAHYGDKPFIVPFAMCQTWKVRNTMLTKKASNCQKYYINAVH